MRQETRGGQVEMHIRGLCRPCVPKIVCFFFLSRSRYGFLAPFSWSVVIYVCLLHDLPMQMGRARCNLTDRLRRPPSHREAGVDGRCVIYSIICQKSKVNRTGSSGNDCNLLGSSVAALTSYEEGQMCVCGAVASGHARWNKHIGGWALMISPRTCCRRPVVSDQHRGLWSKCQQPER